RPLLAQLVARLQAVVDLPSWAPPLTILSVEAFNFLRLKSTFVLRIRYASASAVSSPAFGSILIRWGITARTGRSTYFSTSSIVLTLVSGYSTKNASEMPSTKLAATPRVILSVTFGLLGKRAGSARSRTNAAFRGIVRSMDSLL